MMTRLAIIGFSLMIPFSAVAKQATVWDFTGGSIPGRWDVQGISPNPEPSPEGLYIHADRGGRIMRLTDFAHDVDAVTVTLRNSKPGELTLLWHIRSSPADEIVQLPISIAGNADREVIPLSTSTYGQWDPRTDRIGFAVPEGADITIERIEFTGWNAFEKAWTMLLSFWTFDSFRPYTINFLWGPRLARSPVEHMFLFRVIPPLGWSAMRAFYLAMALAGLVCIVTSMRKRRIFGRIPLAIFMTVFSALWIFYDLRMGSEILGYALTDVRSFVLPPHREKRFRERADFHAFVEMIRPFVQERDRFVFLANYRWPFFGSVRYLVYPSIPTDPEQGLRGVDTWVIYERPEITVNAEGALMVEGSPVSLPGRVLHRFNEGSFVFRTSP